MNRSHGTELVATLSIVFCVAVFVPPAGGAGKAGPTRKQVRTARELSSSGRLAESLAAYEAILVEAAAGEPRAGSWQAEALSEALFESSLLLLASDETLRDVATAVRRLEVLDALQLEPERRLVVDALRTLVGERDAWRSAADGLGLELERERAALAETVAAGEAEARDRAARQLELEGENRSLRRSSRLEAERIAALESELASRTSERDLLLAQLEVAQVDQAQMLRSVFSKNDELVKQSAELSAIRSELEAERKELARREEAIDEREEAIRKATEAILEKESDDGP